MSRGPEELTPTFSDPVGPGFVDYTRSTPVTFIKAMLRRYGTAQATASVLSWLMMRIVSSDTS